MPKLDVSEKAFIFIFCLCYLRPTKLREGDVFSYVCLLLGLQEGAGGPVQGSGPVPLCTGLQPQPLNRFKFVRYEVQTESGWLDFN